MKIFKSFKILKKNIDFNQSIGFVPTMGALHKGHLSLIRKAKKKSKKVLVSIFVNPTQFNDKKDLMKYPRTLKKDILSLKKLKVDYLFLPHKNEIYKKGIKQKIHINSKDKTLCALYRKGHFEGVLAVVNRFMENINSKYIFFGEKDYQQIYLIRKYLQKKFSTKIILCKTIRNKNKLPLSSRNYLLTNKAILRSQKISKIIINFKKKISKSLNNLKMKNYYLSKIQNLCDKVEYFEVRSDKDLSIKFSKKNFKIFIAYYQNKIRLIDNY
tara:strand:- start:264 stop:1073 length:810 start_codon:yes stop_codon:yes gene_type:complete